MMDWLNRGEQAKHRRKRRWRLLGLLLLGVAVAVYWFDRQTSNAFQPASRLDLRRSPSSAEFPGETPGDVATKSSPETAPVAAGGASEPAQSAEGAAASSSASPSDEWNGPEEPNTAEEDETIVQGETGQLAASRGSIGTAVTDTTGSPAEAREATEPNEEPAETGPVPTIAGGLVEGNGTHDCPEGFPIKGNASSRIYHLPGESSYNVTVPEVCFATEEDAEAAGYRPRKH